MRIRIQVTALTLLAGVLILGASACGGGSNASGGTSSHATSGEPEKISGKITVWDPFLGFSPAYGEAAKELDARFEKLHPGVTVDHVNQPFENYESLLQAAFTGHEGPDVLMMSPGNQGVLRYKSGLEELNSRLPDDMSEHLILWNSVSEGFSESAEAPRFAVPIGQGGTIFYYNKALFKKAGLPTEFSPDTWGEVEDAAKKLEAAGIQPIAAGNKEGYENDWWLTVGWPTANNQKQAIELTEGEMSYTDGPLEKAYQPAIAMAEAGLYPSNRFSTNFFPEGVAQFEEGKGAMIFGFWGNWKEYNPKLGANNVGIFLAPGGNYVEDVPEITMALPKFAKNKEAAWAYIEFLASPESQLTIFEKAGWIPNDTTVTLPASAPSQALQLQKVPEEHEVFASLAQMIPGDVLTTLRTEISQVLQGRESIDDALAAAQETAEKTTE
jgi:ABC-type glycerol-3-phosphate transport system substrate-binding protein